MFGQNVWIFAIAPLRVIGRTEGANLGGKGRVAQYCAMCLANKTESGPTRSLSGVAVMIVTLVSFRVLYKL